MANDILVIAEHRDGKLKKITSEAVGAAKMLAESFGGSVEIALLGSGTGSLAQDLSNYGVQVLHFDDPKLADYSYDACGQALVPLIQNRDYAVILLGATPNGLDLAATLGARLKVGVASDCTGLRVEDGRLIATRPIFAAKAIARVALNTKPAIATIRPNTFPAAEPSDGGSVEQVACTIGDLQAVVKEVVIKATGRVELTEADIVVAGGRGLKGPENFKLIEDLAEALGGAAGASRAIVDAGWIEHSYQVGQTGKTVSPKLYIAVGISGAIQHLAGMSSSKIIVAINNNPDAPIFKIADYGIVADALVAVPMMTAELSKLLVS